MQSSPRAATLVLAIALASAPIAASQGCGGSPGPAGGDAPAGGGGAAAGDDRDAGLGAEGDAGGSTLGSDGGTGGDGSTGPDAPVVEATSFTTLYAASDLHAHYTQLAALLLRYGLVASVPADPAQMTWTGGDATFVVAGDLIDKGPASLEVLEAVRALAASAASSSSGGRVIALLGNHEAEFLGTPTDSKFEGQDRIDGELAAQTPAIDPTSFATGADPRGAWLRTLPVAAKIGSWFFAHAGDTGGRSIAQIDGDVTAALATAASYRAGVFVGASSILESDGWYGTSSAGAVAADLAALGAKHIAFGHDPNAFGGKGAILAPAAFAGALVKLDTGLGSDASSGALLRVRHDGAEDVAEALLPDGKTTELWRGAP